MRRVHVRFSAAAVVVAAFALADDPASAQDATTSTTTSESTTTSTTTTSAPRTTATPEMIADAIARSQARTQRLLSSGVPEEFGSEEPFMSSTTK